MQKLNISDLQKVATILDANNISSYDFKVNVSYDADLANLYFNDFKDGSMNDNVNLFLGSCQTDYLVIFENEKVLNESYYKKSKLARMNKDELYGLNYFHELVWRTADCLKSELIDNLLSVNNEEYYKNHYEKEYYQDLDYDFSISGYSQGDYCKVKLVGNVEKWINKEYLTNVFYNTPISGTIEVFKDGVLIDEFSLYDLKGFDEYAYYDKDKLISMVAEYCKGENYKDLLIAYLRLSQEYHVLKKDIEDITKKLSRF